MKKNSKALVIIGGSQSHIPFIKTASELGFFTAVFDQNSSAPGAAIADFFYPISTHDIEKILAQCRRLNNKHPLAGIITYSAYPMPLKAVSKIAETLGLSSFSLDTVEKVTNKILMKKALCEARVPVPEWIKADSLAEASEFMLSCQSPIVVKPASGTTGSIGVSMVTEIDILDTHFDVAVEASQDNTGIVEKFHKGREFSVGGIVSDNEAIVLAMAEKFTLGPCHHFTISGFAIGRISDTDKQWRRNADSILQIALRAVSALDINSSFFTVDLLLEEKSPIVLEVGILLDAKIDRLLYFSGINVYEMICNVAIGKNIKQIGKHEKGYAIKFMFADRNGRLKINPDSEGNHIVDHFDIEWEKMDGEFVHCPHSIEDTIGWVLVEHDNAWSSFREAINISRQNHFRIVETDIR